MKFASALQALKYYCRRRPGLGQPGSVNLEPRVETGARRPLAEERLEPMLTLSLCLNRLRPGERLALARLLAHPDLSLDQVAARYRTRPDLLRKRRSQGMRRLESELIRRGML